MDKVSKQQFSANLLQLREGLGFSQNQLAKMSGLPAASISNFEAGKRMPAFETLLTLARVLEVSLDRLVYGMDDDAYSSGVMRGRAQIKTELQFWIQQSNYTDKLRSGHLTQMIRVNKEPHEQRGESADKTQRKRR